MRESIDTSFYILFYFHVTVKKHSAHGLWTIYQYCYQEPGKQLCSTIFNHSYLNTGTVRSYFKTSNLFAHEQNTIVFNRIRYFLLVRCLEVTSVAVEMNKGKVANLESIVSIRSSFSLNRSFCQICQNCIKQNKFSTKVTSNRDWTLDHRIVVLTSCVYSLMSCQLC